MSCRVEHNRSAPRARPLLFVLSSSSTPSPLSPTSLFRKATEFNDSRQNDTTLGGSVRIAGVQICKYEYPQRSSHSRTERFTTYRQEYTVRRAPGIFSTRLLDGIDICNNAHFRHFCTCPTLLGVTMGYPMPPPPTGYNTPWIIPEVFISRGNNMPSTHGSHGVPHVTSVTLWSISSGYPCDHPCVNSWCTQWAGVA